MEKTFKPGSARESITIEYPSSTNALGKPTWSTFATARAMLEPLSGRELSNPALTGADATHKITTWYIADVKANMRVNIARLTGRHFIVTRPDYPMPGTRELVMYCREVMTA